MQSPVTPSLSQITISHGVTFNVLKPLFLVSEWTAKSKQMWENNACEKVIYFLIIWGELYGNYRYKVIFVSNYELSRFLK
jgi:hypothetical protein